MERFSLGLRERASRFGQQADNKGSDSAMRDGSDA